MRFVPSQYITQGVWARTFITEPIVIVRRPGKQTSLRPEGYIASGTLAERYQNLNRSCALQECRKVFTPHAC